MMTALNRASRPKLAKAIRGEMADNGRLGKSANRPVSYGSATTTKTQRPRHIVLVATTKVEQNSLQDGNCSPPVGSLFL